MESIKVIKMPFFSDDRGVFCKMFASQVKELSHFFIKQVNFVNTISKGVLRGLHYQTNGKEESKFFRVLSGAIQLVFIDLRPESAEYGTSHSVIIGVGNEGVLMPAGYAVGYLVLEDNTSVLYHSDNDYAPDVERGIRWNDPMLRVKWEIENPIVSKKDLEWPELQL